jgi:hypothetical protein
MQTIGHKRAKHWTQKKLLEPRTAMIGTDANHTEKTTGHKSQGPVVPSSVVRWSSSILAWWSQSRSEYGTGWAKGCVSEKHELRFFDDFLFLRNTGRAAKQKLGPAPAWQSRKQKTEQD